MEQKTEKQIFTEKSHSKQKNLFFACFDFFPFCFSLLLFYISLSQKIF